MGFYDEENEEEVEYRNGQRMDGIIVFKAIGLLLGALLAPTIFLSLLVFYVFLRKLRWKPTVTLFPLLISLLIILLLSFTPLSQLNINVIKNSPEIALTSYFYISAILGIIGGYSVILYKVFELKRRPEYKQVRGWAYGFEFVPTPLDKLRKKKNIEALKEGKEFDYEKAPIGVLDAPVISDDIDGSVDTKNADRASIVYRHYSEAMAHTLITGKTGSGKALHIHTEIRCKEKGWTTIGDIEVGDTIYDESGNHTKVLAIYQPMTQDHYELTFDNGEVVKACGDHLWNIGDVRDEITVSTRDLLKNYTYGSSYRITHRIDEIPYTHKILQIKPIADNPEDYLCFTVDSPSHLYLVTRNYIPTHNTVTMLSLIQNDILAGNPLCIIDFKKSPDFIYFLSKWAKDNNRKFYHFVNGKPGTYKNPYQENGQATYDPLSTGGATAKADMILNLRSWDSASEVFKKRTQDVLGSLFFLLERTPRSAAPGIDWESGGLAQFVSALDLNNFKGMIEHMAKDMQAGTLTPGDIRRYNILTDLYRELSSKTKSDLKAQIIELSSIARTLIVSNYGDWLAKGASDNHIDLMEIATSQEAPIVLFSFNQQEEPEFAKYIGSIVMSDLSRVSALKNAKGDTNRFGVYIDEFQTLDPTTVKDNLEKARSSRMYITLSLQSIDQIISSAASQGEALANAILDTTANFIFHDGSGYDTAEKMSKIIGKTERYVYKTTSKSNNKIFKYRLMSIDKAMISRDMKEDWLVPPQEFQSLESPVASNGYKATAYVINKSPDDIRFKRSGGALARKVHVVVEEETARGVSKEFKKQIFIPQVSELEFQEIQAKISLENEETFSLQNEDLHDDGDWEIIEEVEEEIETEETEIVSLPSFEDLVNMENKQKEPIKPEPPQKSGQKKAKVSQLESFNMIKAKSDAKPIEKVKKAKPAEKQEFTLPRLD